MDGRDIEAQRRGYSSYTSAPGWVKLDIDAAKTAVNGCRWCGKPERSHGWEWHFMVRYHQFAPPTDGQRKARLLGNGADNA